MRAPAHWGSRGTHSRATCPAPAPDLIPPTMARSHSRLDPAGPSAGSVYQGQGHRPLDGVARAASARH
eukprot:scaffold1678_cov110-Isochrysis_galbana.AAC.9